MLILTKIMFNFSSTNCIGCLKTKTVGHVFFIANICNTHLVNMRKSMSFFQTNTQSKLVKTFFKWNLELVSSYFRCKMYGKFINTNYYKTIFDQIWIEFLIVISDIVVKYVIFIKGIRNFDSIIYLYTFSKCVLGYSLKKFTFRFKFNCFFLIHHNSRFNYTRIIQLRIFFLEIFTFFPLHIFILKKNNIEQ